MTRKAVKANSTECPKFTKLAWKRKGEAIEKAGKMVCTKCKATKSLKEFPEHRKNRFGKPRYSYCKVCHSEYQRGVSLKAKYGITVEEYNKVLAYQNGACAICKRPPKPGKPRLSVDHNHHTGLVRGLLCWICNRSLGLFRDEEDRFSAAVEYLQHPPVTTVFKVEKFTAPGKVGTKKRAKLLKEMKAKG